MKRSYIRHMFLTAAVLLLGANVFAGGHGYEFCQEHDGYKKNGKKAVARTDLREFTLPATGLIEVDALKNGGISVKGENRGDVLLRACVRAWDENEQALLAVLNNTRIETSGIIRAVNPDDDASFSVSYQLLVPLQTNLRLAAHNGGISISSVDGNLRFETKNGGISLKDVGGDVEGATQNGGVSVKLAGPAFRGTGLRVETMNGGVSLVVPRGFAADIETGTVNGGFKSDFPELAVEKDSKERYVRPKRVSARLNGGGAPVRILTTNGGVRIKSADSSL